ncbi:MAG: DUF502 domain-containing protein [Planctomycetes bacterium]|nr:DUF502 domain-containing protein [Planctomycetota bacterium]
MKRAAVWFWKNGIVSTFMTGFFVLLPFVVTLAIMGWVGSVLVDWLGTQSLVGRGLAAVGVNLLPGEKSKAVATLLGWALVLLVIWMIGLMVKSATRQTLVDSFNSLVDRIPVFNSIYRTVSQVVGMLKKDDKSDLKAMSVVYCQFGAVEGAGFLALLASPQVYTFGGAPCHVVYIPTSPLPMSGGIVFVPVAKVQQLEMTVDDLMQVYFSLGMMSPRVIPEQYRVA